MVKLQILRYPPPEWAVIIEHFPYPPLLTGRPWHLVHEYNYTTPEYPPSSAYFGNWMTQAEALLAAKSLTQLSQVVTDLCPWCHFTYPSAPGVPLVPRFNIYRGQRGEPLIPAIYWDWWNPDPPPGYDWRQPP